MNRTSVSPTQIRLKRMIRRLRDLASRFYHAMFSLRTLISFLGIILTAVICAFAITPVRYNISIGMVPTQTITATRDVVDEVTTESLRVEAENKTQPTYITQEGVMDEVLADLGTIYTQMDSAIQYSETLDDYSATRRYSAEELAYARSILTALDLRDYQLRTLLNTTREDLGIMYSMLYDAIQNTMSSYVIEGSEYIAVTNIMQIVGYRLDTSLLQNVVKPLLDQIIRPNIVIDQEATLAAKEQARADVEPVVYKQGQNIVVKGEGRVERYQYEMLSAMGLLNNTSISINIYLGGALLVALVLSIFMILMRFLCKDIVYNAKRLILLFIIFLLSFVLCIAAKIFNIYLAPVALCALLLSSMLGLKCAFIFNTALAVLVSALAAGSSSAYTTTMVQLLICNLCSGVLGAVVVYKHSSRIRVIAAGIASGIVNFAVMLALALMMGNTETIWLNALWGLAGGAIAGILCVAIQPLLELLFNLPTTTKLLELSNPNHPLLHRLLLEAPGTYHHSIVVSNLAEASAEAIGANPLLARVGGYYHDIGKLRRPMYFKENQLGGENKLIDTDPYTAAQIVISHVHDGAMLARQYHLPREIITIIQEHHGNTPVMYFYTKALKEADGKPVDIANFRYDTNPPATKEGAIVLLCDTIEAAVRSMQNPTPEAIESFIIKLIRGKLQDGQLSNSPLTLKDIDDICHACATVLNGVFHERIEYPDPPKNMQNVTSTAAADKPAPVPEANADLTKPWDGMTPESIPSDDADFDSKPAYIAYTDQLLTPSQQIPIDISDFEPDAPLPEIELPMPEALPSVEEVMESLPLEENDQPNTDDAQTKNQ